MSRLRRVDDRCTCFILFFSDPRLDSEVVNPLTSGFPSHSEAFVNLSAADRCKVDVASAFAISSLTWIWLKTLGQDPKETEVVLLIEHG